MPLFVAVTTCLPVWHCTACLHSQAWGPGPGNREMIVIALVLAFKRPFNGNAFHRREQQGFRKPTSQHHWGTGVQLRLKEPPTVEKAFHLLILQRRTKTITIESEGRGSTFAKASFVASGNRTDISLDDPNFWDKWAKKAEIDMDTANDRNSLVIDTPRVRKQTRPFSATKDELAELSEGESDNEDKPKLRRPHDRLNSYGRTECFRVEKNLLVYGHRAMQGFHRKFSIVPRAVVLKPWIVRWVARWPNGDTLCGFADLRVFPSGWNVD
ncbi:hypothetical protein J4Q44_G00351850 [Coregonus suidteri]|uniref:Uncharacterized protein n=1 Tax=Coregonus suidteri TaxID=861788 RepID=A0AAN8KYH8_9TELE